MIAEKEGIAAGVLGSVFTVELSQLNRTFSGRQSPDTESFRKHLLSLCLVRLRMGGTGPRGRSIILFKRRGKKEHTVIGFKMIVVNKQKKKQSKNSHVIVISINKK